MHVVTIQSTTLLEFYLQIVFLLWKHRYIGTKMWKQNVEISLHRDENVRTSLSNVFCCPGLKMFPSSSSQVPFCSKCHKSAFANSNIFYEHE